jgi:hypothetical protein
MESASGDNRRGLIFGDPVNGRMVLMWTDCGGERWIAIPDSLCPKLVEGEAAFAASGTTIRTLPGGHVYIAAGGSKIALMAFPRLRISLGKFLKRRSYRENSSAGNIHDGAKRHFNHHYRRW